MSYGVKLHVWGERACFTRPEMKVERVSYDVMTPSAARGILEAIHWKPSIRWIVDAIHVLKPIRFQSIRRNEVGSRIPAAAVRKAMKAGAVHDLRMDAAENRQQRAATLLVDVAYVIEAHFELTDRAGEGDTPAKHISMFNRRATDGQCFHQPCFGTREFPAHFSLVEGAPPPSELTGDDRERDLGWMLLDIAHERDSRIGNQHCCTPNCTPLFFRAGLRNGVLAVPPPESVEVRS
ncbi:type I-C CRISPR-associated protein Cas5c [Azospirillum doebereinerae]|uniref:pre-crRNA processing endonuclease n=1 Tax=Azospirillum doebereinerae TaxID=92933 RepID=A0A3S0V8M7_9PROT|nr:type I-C CRISPR-associated protein Cas5c [Azospirillum doebereinerae]MCG5242231.1 type I-C CRISPR-associated protein Cas5c [Azospirillum doebereinerae]RUQ75548.1 type I-C CRISPR-associated protein Cas5 [Azospirillum doebereinerae]